MPDFMIFGGLRDVFASDPPTAQAPSMIHNMLLE
jgi:hypothetical protein